MIMKNNSILAKMLHSIANDIEQDHYTCSDEEFSQAIDNLAQFNNERPMSKEQACMYLNMTRSVFDTHIRNGLIPKGEKRMGFKELSWTQAQLDKAVEDMKEYGYN